MNKFCKTKFVILDMLLQIEDTSQVNINKLIEFAKQNKIEMSFVDDINNNYWLPGKPLTEYELTELITKSRNSGVISMKNAHTIIRNSNTG